MINSISIVIPVYNEEEIVEDSISSLIPELRRYYQKIDLILTENGSYDNTKEIIKKLELKWNEVTSIVEDGIADYGQALINGIEISRYDEVSILELDYLDLSFLKRSYLLLSEYDLIIGSKALSQKVDQRPWKRKLYTYCYNLIIRTMFNLTIRETHGLKTFRKSRLVRIIESCFTRHAVFPTELVIRASIDKNIKICEIPLTLPIIEIRKARISATRRFKKTIEELILLRRALKSKL